MTTLLLHEVSPGESLRGIARQYDSSVRQLKALNGLRSAQLFLGEILLIQVDDEAIPAEPKSRNLIDAGLTHTVKAGDNLFRIAKLYNISLEQLKKDNQLRSDKISIGMVLHIGTKPILTEVVTDQNIDFYTVVKGDTLFKIAKQHQMEVAALRALNNLRSDVLSIGMRLRVKVKAGGNSFPPPAPNPTRPDLRPNPPSPAPPNANTGSDLVRQRNDTNNNLVLDIRMPNGGINSFVLRRHLNGYTYAGLSQNIPSREDIIRVGLSPAQFNALQFCKKVEGRYDAINTYDSGVFSYGFIQFTAKFKSLDLLLQSMKNNAPLQFRQTFERAGINISNGQIRLLDLPPSFTTAQIWEQIRTRADLFVPFIQAGFVPQLILEQYRVANAEYVLPSLNAFLTLNLANGNRVQVPVLNVFRDLPTQALAVAMGVNLGPKMMITVLNETLSDLAQRRKVVDVLGLSSVPWQEVCQHIVDFETRVINSPDQGFRKSKLTIERAIKVRDNGVPVIYT